VPEKQVVLKLEKLINVSFIKVKFAIYARALVIFYKIFFIHICKASEEKEG